MSLPPFLFQLFLFCKAFIYGEFNRAMRFLESRFRLISDYFTDIRKVFRITLDGDESSGTNIEL